MKKQTTTQRSALRTLIDPFASALERAGTVENALVVLHQLLDAVRAAEPSLNLSSFLGFVSDWVSEVHDRRGTVGARGYEGMVAVYAALSAASSVRPDIDAAARFHECLAAMRDEA